MEYLLKVSALLTVFYVVYQFLLQKETFFEINRVFLLVGLLVSFLLPLWTISVYHEYVPETLAVETYQDQEFTEVVTPIVLPTIVERTFDVGGYIPFAYGIGIVVFLSFFVFRLISLLRACIKTKSYQEGKFAMIESSHDVSPFSFFKWIVFNPNQFQQEELEQIVAHEKAHAQQYHSVDILIVELCCVLLWFHPLVWLYNKSLKQNLEFLADKYALHKIKNKKSYQYTLLKASVDVSGMALSNQFYNSLIKKRIVMLQKTKSNKINLLKYLLVLPALGYFLMGFNTKDVFVEKKSDKVKIVIDKSTSDDKLKKHKEFFKKEYSSGLKLGGKKSKSFKKKIKEVENKRKDRKVERALLAGKRLELDEQQRKNIKYIVDGKEVSEVEFKKINPSEIESISVVKGEAALKKYGKNIDVIEVVKKDSSELKSEKSKNKSEIRVVEYDVSVKKDTMQYSVPSNTLKLDKIPFPKGVLYYVNGKEVTKEDFNKVNPEIIYSINVLRDKSAIEKYGEKGKKGVVEITTKDKNQKNTDIKVVEYGVSRDTIQYNIEIK